jgi:hypothetical protein
MPFLYAFSPVKVLLLVTASMGAQPWPSWLFWGCCQSGDGHRLAWQPWRMTRGWYARRVRVDLGGTDSGSETVVTCRTCGGTGKVRASQGFFTVERTCPSCEGPGQEIDQAQRIEIRRRFWHSNFDIIKKFLEIAERKVSVIDDYGDENWDALPKEMEVCLGKIAKRNSIKPDDTLPDAFRWLERQLEPYFRKYHQQQKERRADSFNVHGMSGVEFEMWLAKVLREKGFEVQGTSATGDQGADLIAKKDGRTIIIQAKRYQGTVGNKAVQEVISALAYYGGDEGWVVTNASFTPSAKALAQKSKIRLVDGIMLRDGAI